MPVTDTTPWVAFFQGESCPFLETALLAGTVEIPALVKLEVLGNALGRERKNLEKIFSNLSLKGTDPEHFTRAARLKATLEEKAIFLSARDAHILQCALDGDGLLISNDPLFARIQKSTGVRVQMW